MLSHLRLKRPNTPQFVIEILTSHFFVLASEFSNEHEYSFSLYELQFQRDPDCAKPEFQLNSRTSTRNIYQEVTQQICLYAHMVKCII